MSAHVLFSLSFRKIFQQKNLSGIHGAAYVNSEVAKPVGERGTGIDTDGLLTVLPGSLVLLINGSRTRLSADKLYGMTGAGL